MGSNSMGDFNTNVSHGATPGRKALSRNLLRIHEYQLSDMCKCSRTTQAWIGIGVSCAFGFSMLLAASSAENRWYPMLMILVILVMPAPVAVLSSIEVDLEQTHGVNQFNNFSMCLLGTTGVFVIGFPVYLYQFGVASALQLGLMLGSLPVIGIGAGVSAQWFPKEDEESGGLLS